MKSFLRTAPTRLIISLLFCAASVVAQSATISVTDFGDSFDDNDGTCTLREAIRSANTGSDVDGCERFGGGNLIEIQLSAGTYNIDLSTGSAENDSLDGDLDILRTMSIHGVSAEYTVIDGDAQSSQERLFDLFADSLVTMTALTITGGREPVENGGNIRIDLLARLTIRDAVVSDGRAANGGGIYGGSVQLIGSVVRDNATLGEAGFGGGIALSDGGGFPAELILQDSIVTDNQAAVGGGIHAAGETLEVHGSRIEGNAAVVGPGAADTGWGGGLAIFTTSAFTIQRTLITDNQALRGAGIYWGGEISSTITHSAIVNNVATENGGGVYSAIDGSIRYSTIAANSAAMGGGIYANSDMTLLDAVTLAANTGGGGLFNERGAIFEFSIIADNTDGNCLGSPTVAVMFNLEDSDTCTLSGTSLTSTNPILGPLQDNGGGLPTLALLPGSPAIDAYTSEDRMDCHQIPDQRTYARGNPPVLGDGSDGDHLCDIGAYEFSAPFVVNSTDDTVDSDRNDGLCADMNGNCTLRAAVMQSEAVRGFNEIELDAQTYALTLGGGLLIGRDVVIRGQGIEETIIDGAGLDHIIGRPLLTVNARPTDLNIIRLQDLTLQGGVAVAGGAIQAWKPMELQRVALRNNRASSSVGGAILCTETCELSIVDSTFDGNSSSGNGGAIYHNTDGHLFINRTTFSNNSASTGGALETTTKVHAKNSTFSGNSAGSSAAMFVNSAVLENVTMTDNTATSDTGAVFILGISAIVNSIISSNQASGVADNCSISGKFIVSVGNNISDTDAEDCGLTHASDLVDTDPMLGPLADNGGPTETHLPLAGSPALDAGNTDSCTDLDQRGFSRSDACDIGSVEVQSADIAVAISATPSPVTQGTNVTLTVTASNNGPADATNVTAITTLPASMSFVSGMAGANDCTAASGVVTCELGDVPNGSSATASVIVSTDQTGVATVSVEASTNSTDNTAANNTAETSVTINAPASGGGGGNSSGGGGGSMGPLGLAALFFWVAWVCLTGNRYYSSLDRLRSIVAGLVTGTALIFSSPLQAGPVTDLVVFSPSTTARSAEVNGNFDAVGVAVNDNDARTAALESEIADLNDALINVMQINQYLSLETVNGQPAVRITAANLQLVNGLGSTASTNGTGNLLVGYDEETTVGLPICSNGNYKIEADCTANSGAWSNIHKTGSNSVIVGSSHNFSRYGSLVAGADNSATGIYSSVTGGIGNLASATLSSVNGGDRNTARGTSGSVGGGLLNFAIGRHSVVSGGRQNVSFGPSSSVSGGSLNNASGADSSVSGGSSNTAFGPRSSVSGGEFNSANGVASSVSGGSVGVAIGDLDWVAGTLLEDH